MKNIDVLYIHPGRHMSDYNIPMGVIGLMNSIDCKKIGKMYFEVSEKDITNSKIIVMDCHWFYPLAEIGRLSKKYKKINPKIIIIVGGQTASIFAEMIVEKYEIDYVIKGDAERPFTLLVKELLEGRNGSVVPNIVNKSFIAPQSYSLTEEDYSRGDYLTIDWFPSLQKRLKNVQKIIDYGPTEIMGSYPFIPIFKGCRYDCEFCYGNQSMHNKLFRRGLIARRSEAVIKDLSLCSKRNDIKQVFIIADFVNILGEKYANEVFSQKYNLNLYYEFEHFNFPDIDLLDKIIKSFNKCFFTFIFAEPFIKSPIERFNYLKDIFDYFRKARKEVKVALYCSRTEEYFRYYKELQYCYDGLLLINCGNWFLPIPSVYGKKNYAEQVKYFDYWRKRSDAESADNFIAKGVRDDEKEFNVIKNVVKKKNYFNLLRRTKERELFG